LRAAARLDVPPREERVLDLDVLLEAVSTACEGSWASFASLVAQLADEPWAAQEAARRLQALGHIEIARGPEVLSPVSWCIAPPAIVIPTDADEAQPFLAGWRSEGLIHLLGHEVGRRGGFQRFSACPDGPALITFRGLDAPTLREAAEEASERLPMPIEVVEAPAERLVHALPSLDELRMSLPRVAAIDYEGTERFDPLRGWVRAEGAGGCFRTRRFPRVIWHELGTDRRRVTSRLGKWLAASRSVPLLAWEAATRSVACHLGAEPPGLFERALVLCSGQLPERRGNHVVYRGVGEEVAWAVAARLQVPVT
jgi:hypothetical protein